MKKVLSLDQDDSGLTFSIAPPDEHEDVIWSLLNDLAMTITSSRQDADETGASITEYLEVIFATMGRIKELIESEVKGGDDE